MFTEEMDVTLDGHRFPSRPVKMRGNAIHEEIGMIANDNEVASRLRYACRFRVERVHLRQVFICQDEGYQVIVCRF